MILCLNTGSSSLKFALYEKEHLALVLLGAIEEIGQKQGLFWVKDAQGGKLLEEKAPFPLFLDGIQRLFHFLDSSKYRSSLVATGHRIVHGGSYYSHPQVIDKNVLSTLEELIPLAPLHLPQELEVLKEIMGLFPDLEHVACFDTSFFSTLPETSRRFALPKALLDEKIVRYGFHGLSYEYITSKLHPLPSKVIIAHLGSGASLAAIKEGKPIDTTMGFSPAGGVIMGTRLGDIDPGVLIYLMRHKGIGINELENIVYKKSGLLALSDLSSDMHILLQAKSTFAVEMFCTSVAKTIGSYFVELGGLDQLIFTAGIGERADTIRKTICDKLRPLGALLNEKKNSVHAEVISSTDSAFMINVIPTNENYVIANHVNSIQSSLSR